MAQIGGGVTLSIIEDGLAIEGGQEILPNHVIIAIGHPVFREDIAIIIVGHGIFYHAVDGFGKQLAEGIILMDIIILFLVKDVNLKKTPASEDAGETFLFFN